MGSPPNSRGKRAPWGARRPHVRFVVTGEWSRNRLLQTIVVLYVIYVAGLWLTNALLYFNKMSLYPSSVAAYYLGNEEQFLSPRSYQGMLEIAHFHLFAMGMLLLVLTHLMLFVPIRNGTKALLIALPFFAALLDEGSGWAVRFVHPGFAWAKVAGFLLLQGSLAALIGVSLWAVFGGGAVRSSPESCAERASVGPWQETVDDQRSEATAFGSLVRVARCRVGQSRASNWWVCVNENRSIGPAIRSFAKP